MKIDDDEFSAGLPHFSDIPIHLFLRIVIQMNILLFLCKIKNRVIEVGGVRGKPDLEAFLLQHQPAGFLLIAEHACAQKSVLIFKGQGLLEPLYSRIAVVIVAVDQNIKARAAQGVEISLRRVEVRLAIDLSALHRQRALTLRLASPDFR